MTQLTYNEAFDPYHAAFRFLRLHTACVLAARVPFDLFRVLDFYLLFPFRLQGMRFQSDDTDWRQISKSYSGWVPYGELPEDVTIFARMEPFQRAAASSLALKGYLSSAAWERNEVEFTELELPSDVASRCVAQNKKMPDFMAVLCELPQKYRLTGRDGLKDRTGLMEFRYDPL